MAFITKQQQREILQQIPPGQDPARVFQGLIERGNTLEGYAPPTAQASPITQSGPAQNPQQQDGFFKSLVKDPIKTLLVKPATRAGQVVADVGAPLLSKIPGSASTDEIRRRIYQDNTNVDIPVLGHYSVEPQKMGQEGVKQIAGDALKSAAYLYTPGAVTAGGSTLVKGALTGAKGGAIGGGMFAASGAIQDDKATVESVIKDTAGGAAVGGVGGAAIGAASAVTVEKLSDVARKSAENEWKKILNLTNKQTNAETKSGKDVVKKLIDSRLLPDGIDDGRAVLDKTIEQAREQALVGDKLLSTILDYEPSQPLAADVYAKALTKLKSSGVAREQAEQFLQNQMSAFIKQSGKVPTPEGNLPLGAWNDIKGQAWTNVVDFADPARSVKNDANNAIARAIKEIIEDNVDNVDVRALNAEIGDWWHVFEVLMDRNGKKVLGRGITRLANRIIGGTAGAVSGGPTGSIAGSYAADKLSAWLGDSTTPLQVKMALLTKLQGNPETAAIVTQALQALKGKEASMLATPMLQAGSGPIDAMTPNIPPSSQGRPAGMSNKTIMAGPPSGGDSFKVYNTPMPPPSMMQAPGWKGTPVTDIPKVRAGSLADEGAKLSSNRPAHQVTIEKLINAGDYLKAKTLIEALPKTGPYRESMMALIKRYLP